ncbi:MAG: Nine-heme cytochrome C [Desulfovibrio sp.]|nr:Nine-heme cytochrome C [Desulfovibrio sp.]
MKNGATLFLLVVIAVVGATYPAVGGANDASAALLGATESGVPSAMVIFPVSNGGTPDAVGMNPVVFNHLAHEEKIEDCKSCHHTGETVSCTSCHTVQGKAEGKFITLSEAMHTSKILKRGEGNTPQSCVSCHARQAQRQECAGCHSIVKITRDQTRCNACHNAAGLAKEDIAAGIAGNLPAEKNAEIAAQTLQAHKNVTSLQPADGPYKVMIGGISNQYKAGMFAHRRHVETLMERIEGDGLAATFHAKQTSLCAACHHRSPLQGLPPRCGSCHAPQINPASPDSLHLKAAYHLLCMGCHQGMNIPRPLDTSCATCHKENTPLSSEK